MLSSVVALCSVFSAALAAPVSETRETFGWKEIAVPHAQLPVTIHFAVVHPEGAKATLSKTLKDVSYGGSRYTQYLTRDQVVQMMAPVEESMQTTLSWCRENSFECEITGTGDVVRATATVQVLESVLNTKLSVFSHDESEGVVVKSAEYVALPAALESHVEVMYGLNNFPTIFPKKNFVKTTAGPQVTPQLLQKLYNITNVAQGDKSSMAVAEFQGQAFLPKDLHSFEQEFDISTQPVRRILGGNPDADKSAGVEASLDIQYIIATGPGVNADFFLLKGNAFDLFGWAGEALNDTTPDLVWSVSYGEGVNGGIGGVIPVATVQRLNTEMEKFGVMGSTVFVASGDSGVYSRRGKVEFHPSYPACLPAVTAVGATELESDGSEDSAVSFSGGGFTPRAYFTYAGDASWQNESVQAYFKSGVELPPSRYYDNTGRGIPDISAVGVDFAVYASGRKEGVSGTSASTPACAGIFALVNDALLEAGKKPIGFANPFIYSHQEAFHDILKGYNNAGGLFSKGFHATKGWDPLTGVGTPIYSKIKDAALAAQQ